MIFTPLGLAGAFAVDLDRREDARGFFARLFCEQEFADHALATTWMQCNTSFSHAEGTLRGLHFQRPPMAEAKLVKCLHGAIFDVMVDLRLKSPTFGRWASLVLSAENRTMAYVPPGFAHGFQTLVPETELLYFHSQAYSPAHEGGLLYDDRELNIPWPLPVADLSPRDAVHPVLAMLEPIA
jgi:dTDP-4-dehydrorhamnose 3,5-epimerase